MKFALILVFLCSANAVAQQASPDAPPSEVTTSLSKGTWDIGAIGAGGAGLGARFNTQFAAVGVRIGRILSNERYAGWRRGNFEWAVELLPVYTVFTPQRTIYGGSFVPVLWRWNFTSGRHIAPYASLACGVLFNTHNVPPGNTSWVNFTPQAAVGANFFVRPRGAFTFEGAFVHHSNAWLGTNDPGYNGSFIFSVGYTFFRPPKGAEHK